MSSNRNSNRAEVPEAREAHDQFKFVIVKMFS